MEKDSTTVLFMVSGRVTGKQIELDFMNLVGSSTWRWNARQIGEDRFVMRFSSDKMVKEWSYFRSFAMRYCQIYGPGVPAPPVYSTTSNYRARGHDGGPLRLNGITDLKIKAYEEYSELAYLDDSI
jgi:hypothetical protein